MSNIVTPKELEELTGFKRPAEQANCLRVHKIFYIEGKDGQIRTTWHHVNHPLALNISNGINLEALDVA